MAGEHHAHQHHHAPSSDADRNKLAAALAIIVVFMFVEIAAGLVANSLALITDAAHMLTDALAIGLALVAARLAARPSSASFTFGLSRAEILSAQVNGASLLVLAAFLGYETVRRFFDPPEVEGGLVIVVGVLGALANIGAAWMLARAERQSLNVEGAMRHVLADLFASVAAIISGVVIVLSGFELADPIAAFVVVLLMLRSGWTLIRDSGRILLEAVPRGFDSREVGMALARHPRVAEVHDLHVWEVTSGFPALSAHIVCLSHEDCHEIRRELERTLHEQFGIDHTTLQVDHEHEDLLKIEGS